MNTILVFALSAIVALLSGAEAVMTNCDIMKRRILLQKKARIFLGAEPTTPDITTQTCYEPYIDQYGILDPATQ